jgi:diguanylate cyclase (GGDEF)-like protein
MTQESTADHVPAAAAGAGPSAGSATVPGPERATVPCDLGEMLDLLAQTIVETLGFGVACINLGRPDGSFDVVAVAGDESAREALLGRTDPPGAWDRILTASEHWGRLRFSDHRVSQDHLDDLTWIPDFEPLAVPDAWHPEDALFAPLLGEDGTMIGVLSVDLPDGGVRPGPAVCRGLEAFAVSAALAIEHATFRTRAEAAEARYRELAMSDPLTGLGNRTLLLDRVQHALRGRPEDTGELALVFVDLDGFKRVNDRYSHEVGDRALQEVARRLTTIVRPHDTVARWGGDEFLVLLENLKNRAAGDQLATRIHDALAETIRIADAEISISASVGLVFRDGQDETGTGELVRRADAAMYAAKRTGGGVRVDAGD